MKLSTEHNNEIRQNNGRMTIKLDVYLFMEDTAYIAYSPALDLSGYGNTEAEAKESFSVVMDEYISYGLSRRTLVADLRAHGWKVRSLKQRKMAAPSFDMLFKTNDTFRDILENKEYTKVYEPLAMPNP